jgi:hypothetical protein
MASARWLAFLWVLPFAGCLQASVAPGHAGAGLEGTSRAPSIAFLKDGQEGRLVVSAVEAGFGWAALGVSADRSGTVVRAGGAEEDGEGPPVALAPNAVGHPSSSPDDVVAGDFLRFCSAEAAQGPVTYAIVETEGNRIVFTATFDPVAPCG